METVTSGSDGWRTPRCTPRCWTRERWFGETLYSRDIAHRHDPVHTCSGEFGPDGKRWISHCSEHPSQRAA